MMEDPLVVRGVVGCTEEERYGGYLNKIQGSLSKSLCQRDSNGQNPLSTMLAKQKRREGKKEVEVENPQESR